MCVKFELDRTAHHKKICLAANEKMGWLLGKKENSEVPHGLSVIKDQRNMETKEAIRNRQSGIADNGNQELHRQIELENRKSE